ncbi:hypothetical protein GCM10020331_038830 [Ectobacillus funiculus]
MFRYPGPKASSKESAVVGIADSVEAAVRSMNAPTPEQIAQLVQGIIADRLKDGQFSECNLTFKELQTIEKTICETLNGIFFIHALNIQTYKIAGGIYGSDN